MKLCYLSKTLDQLRNYFNFHRITWHRKMCGLLVSGLQSPGILGSHTSEWVRANMDFGDSWASFVVCFLSLFLPRLRSPTGVSMRHGVLQRENKSRVGVENNQSTSAHPDPLLASASPFCLFLYYPCLWYNDSKEQEFHVLWVLLLSVFHAFCPRILNLFLR